MMRRFRFLASLLALVAFSAYFAENVVSVLCAPLPDTVEVAAGPADSHHQGHHGSGPDDGKRDSAPSHDSHCPLGMNGATCVGFSLPAAVMAGSAPPTRAEPAFSAAEQNVELLLTRSLYHPPRA